MHDLVRIPGGLRRRMLTFGPRRTLSCKRVLPGSLDITRFSVVKEAMESKKRAQHYIAVGRTCSRFVNLHDLRW